MKKKHKTTKYYLDGLGWTDYHQEGDVHIFTRRGEKTDPYPEFTTSISEDKKTITITPKITKLPYLKISK